MSSRSEASRGDAPAISVVMPVRNEATALPSAVESVMAQEVPGRLEIVIAIGPSDDGTREVAERLAAEHPEILVVDNPSGRTPTGLNLAIGAASSDVVARLDGHAELSRGYLMLALESLARPGVVNAGGIQHAVGHTALQRVIAKAMSTRLGVGNAHFHYGGEPGPTDTVYLGVFDRQALVEAGGFDERLLRNQDYELNWRLRDRGGTVWFDPRLVVAYTPRASFGALARQYFDYGKWKRRVITMHPRSMRWRQLAAPCAVVLITAGLMTAARGYRWGLLMPAGYLSALGVGALAEAVRHHDRSFAALVPVWATMHMAWGLGFLIGRTRTNDSALAHPS